NRPVRSHAYLGPALDQVGLGVAPPGDESKGAHQRSGCTERNQRLETEVRLARQHAHGIASHHDPYPDCLAAGHVDLPRTECGAGGTGYFPDAGGGLDWYIYGPAGRGKVSGTNKNIRCAGPGLYAGVPDLSLRFHGLNLYRTYFGGFQ